MDDATRARLVDIIVRLEKFHTRVPTHNEINVPGYVDGLAVALAHEGYSASKVREGYKRSIKRMSDEYLVKFEKAGTLEDKERWAREASAKRNAYLKEARDKGTLIARKLAERLKRKGLTFEKVIASNMEDLFPDRQWTDLNENERIKVMRAVVKKSGVDRPNVSTKVKIFGVASRGLWALTLASAFVQVVTAENKAEALVREGASAAGGFGGALLGAKVGLICLGGAFICSPVFALIGAIGGATIMEEATEMVSDWLSE